MFFDLLKFFSFTISKLDATKFLDFEAVNLSFFSLFGEDCPNSEIV